MTEKLTNIQRIIRYNVTSMRNYDPIICSLEEWRIRASEIGELGTDEERLECWMVAANVTYSPNFAGRDLSNFPAEVCNYCFNEGAVNFAGFKNFEP